MAPVLAEDDLFICLMGSPSRKAPRVGFWSAAIDGNPRQLPDLTDNEAQMLAALALPAEFSRPPAGEPARDPGDVLASISGPFTTDAALLDARGVNATARSRARPILKEKLTSPRHDAGDYVDVDRPPYSAPLVKTDVVELIRAVRDGRADDARRILAVATAPDWEAGASDEINRDALNRRPDMVTDPAAAALLGDAVEAGLGRPGEDGDETPWRKRLVVAGLVLAAVLGIVAAVLLTTGSDDKTKDPVAGLHGPKIALVIDNRVTDGAHRMRQDNDHPVQLTERPRPFCDAAKCIPGTSRLSGQAYRSAVCQIEGDHRLLAMSNGNDQDTADGRADDHNPGIYHSWTYYGVRLEDGTEGYVSDVWVRTAQRAGHVKLPRCPSGFPRVRP
jgi:hypothetical protein